MVKIVFGKFRREFEWLLQIDRNYYFLVLSGFYGAFFQLFSPWYLILIKSNIFLIFLWFYLFNWGSFMDWNWERGARGKRSILKIIKWARGELLPWPWTNPPQITRVQFHLNFYFDFFIIFIKYKYVEQNPNQSGDISFQSWPCCSKRRNTISLKFWLWRPVPENWQVTRGFPVWFFLSWGIDYRIKSEKAKCGCFNNPISHCVLGDPPSIKKRVLEKICWASFEISAHSGILESSIDLNQFFRYIVETFDP